MSRGDIHAKLLLQAMNTQFQKNIIEDGFTIGKVTNLDPLTIDVEGLPLYRSNLYINPYLLEWDEQVDITTSTVDNHSHTITTIHHPSKLKNDNLVAMYGIEYDSDGKSYQRYCVFCVLS
jgi:ankyrin repeat protein